MKSLNPKRWHVATFAALFLWSAWSVWANVPHASYIEGMSAHIEETAASIPAKLPARQTAAVIQGAYSVGFPVHYLSYTKAVGTPPGRSYLSIPRFALNVLVCICAMVALALCTQHNDRFSTKTMLVVVAGAAVLIACFPLMDSIARLVAKQFSNHTFPFLLPYLYIMAVYFSPIPIAIALHSKAGVKAEPERCTRMGDDADPESTSNAPSA